MPRIRVLFHGRVQGVGFRATVRSLAHRQPVTGFVRNRSDGTVELEAQGALHHIEALLTEILRQFAGYVTDMDRTELSEIAGETEFTVRY